MLANWLAADKSGWVIPEKSDVGHRFFWHISDRRSGFVK
jgi:hypothetical protein